MFNYRKIAIFLVAFLCLAVVPWSVNAADVSPEAILDSAAVPDEEVLSDIEVIFDSESIITNVEVSTEKQPALEGLDTSALAVDGKSAVLMDADSGKVIFEQNAHDRLPPASVTKVMTMLLVMEAVERGQLSLTDQVPISERAASMGGSQMYMEPGEAHPLETLMTGIAIASANDGCVAAAEFHSGSVEIFVENMNKRAAELGMENTNFVNTNGLPVANHYSSAYDIALMSKELLKHKKIHDWFSIWMTNVTVGLPGKKQTELGLTNTNRLIKTYPGANGIKTGFTQEAGYCLSASATRGDLTLIAVIMGSPSSKIRFAEASKLLDYGFANYDSVMLAEGGEPLGSIVIEKGSPSVLNGVAPEKVNVLVRKGQKEGIGGELVFDSPLYAPIEKGQKIGELIVYQHEQEISRYPVLAEEDVNQASLLEIYIRMIKTLS